MTGRAYNFNAGPAALPLEVLQQAQAEFVDFKDSGMSIMEMSHRGAIYEGVHNETQALLKELLAIPEGYQILFLQGGASTQFAMIPMNFLQGRTGSYVHTGSWADKAIKEAKSFGNVQIAATSEANKYMNIPALSTLNYPQDAAYLHITSNETIEGTQFQQYPDTGGVPLIADLSSDIMSRPLDVSQFGMIYAGAQKNLGPSGVTLVILRKDLLGDVPKSVPTMFRYDTHLKNNSLYNTPPGYSIYMVNLVLKWIKGKGGLAGIEQLNREKTGLIYNAIDTSEGFYTGCVDADSRSMMNVTFRLANEELEKQFVKASEAAGFIGLKGHRSVGGLRASTYNAVTRESCEALSAFMAEFQRVNG
ncbi:MFS transporter [Paenibacillus swuensis]|uniref:Phosphoserine aminotransferase n=1 Tax=Paenibacillus swuensis TaxID=1178515 RepID=A0A172TN93_9BACL|nr:3-phosphoserine/phosphohydroxythreonine transaminase [Paenibacillus swuensis]ANE48559.1 MFS transporter [Paenibacillus swuensis]